MKCQKCKGTGMVGTETQGVRMIVPCLACNGRGTTCEEKPAWCTECNRLVSHHYPASAVAWAMEKAKEF